MVKFMLNETLTLNIENYITTAMGSIHENLGMGTKITFLSQGVGKFHYFFFQYLQ